MKDRILIEKELIPYTFDILLGDELFTLDVNYNKTADLFTVALLQEDEVICAGEPLVYGVPLFQDVYSAGKFPAITITPLDEANTTDRITYENMNDTVFLCIEDEGEEDDE